MLRDSEPAPIVLADARPSVNATRSVSSSRSRRRAEALRGNVLALKHGVFADVANARDVAVEIDLIFATHAHLDPLADRRLVESLAVASVHYARATQAIDREGWQQQLIAAARDFGNRAERLERAVHERERERAKAAQTVASAADLDAYRRPKAVS